MSYWMNMSMAFKGDRVRQKLGQEIERTFTLNLLSQIYHGIWAVDKPNVQTKLQAWPNLIYMFECRVLSEEVMLWIKFALLNLAFQMSYWIITHICPDDSFRGRCSSCQYIFPSQKSIYMYSFVLDSNNPYKLMLLPESLCICWQLHMFFFFSLYKFPFPNKVWKVSQRV